MVLSAGVRQGEAYRRTRRLLEGRRGNAVDVDGTYLGRAVELARRAIADASPNPPVGCVLVRDGVTLGEGWHHRRGEPHAEVEALRDARARHADTRGATAYVSLEPCNHHGRTPPCSDALIDAGVERVVVGTLDPNPRTAAGGVQRLRDAGVAVDVRHDEAAHDLVARFRWIITNPAPPFVTLKMAASLDGYVTSEPGVQQWLTGERVRERVRDLRVEHDGILVGAGTVRIDDPLLTVRPHATRRKPYVRVVACETDAIPPASRILAPPAGAPADAYAATIVLAPAGARDRFVTLEAVADVIYVGDAAATQLDLTAALAALRDREITTLLCEGGPTLAGRLLERDLVQRVEWFLAPRFLRNDRAVPALGGADVRGVNGWRFERIERVGDDLLLVADLTACSRA